MNPTIAAQHYEDTTQLAQALKDYGLALQPGEARSIRDKIGRVPTLAELFVFDIEWSEHCSYKSSKHLLKKYLPVDGRHVIQGPEEDAGIVYFTTKDGARYGIVIAHESHNHPSQVLPFEGAATGIGGIVRDVDCMGASVIAVADPLRFGDPQGNHAQRTQAIINGVVDGIQHYGNALGVPNIGGDVVFHPGYDDNCLVNVVALGLLREDEIIHSRVPQGGVGHDLILVGKPTDRSGFGGATFSSGTLDQDDEEVNKGAVQIPDPFLKNILLHYKANHAVRRRAQEQGFAIGMKDLGAGGIACSTSELGASAGYGIEIFLEQVHIAENNLPPEIILCAETQERYVLSVPPEFTPEVLRIYNEDWELPAICSGAGARVIGKVIQEPVMRVWHHNEAIVDLPIDFVVEGIRYDRESRAPCGNANVSPAPGRQETCASKGCEAIMRQMLASPNIASKEWIYRHYDTEVQGHSYIRPGEADASVIVPLDGSPAGVALSVDGNPFYGERSPFWGGAAAIAESMRNVAAVGATPRAFTDCLNFGNPTVPEDFWALEEGIKGIADAAKNLYDPLDQHEAIPFVSGNVSLYNQSSSGVSVPPSPIIACLGVIDDASKAITMDLKQADSSLVLVGPRYDELDGSEYSRLVGAQASRPHNADETAALPVIRYPEEQGIIYGTIKAIGQRLVRAAHDISNGGLAITLAEMLLACHADSALGIEVDLFHLNSDLQPDALLFSESSGMVLEIAPDHLPAVKQVYRQYNMVVFELGRTTQNRQMTVCNNGQPLFTLSASTMRRAWRGEFGLSLAS